jgi:phytoene dehydrogenase-like protein
MMTSRNEEIDVIVVGGGHNGLVCANYLARSGRSVLVLEANDSFGGAASTLEFADNFRVSACAHWLNQLNPKVLAELDLENHGLKLAARDLNTISLAKDGNHLTLRSDGIEGVAVSELDRIAYLRFNSQMLKFAELLAKVFERRPPKIIDGDFGDRISLVKLAVGMKMLGKEDMRDLLRLVLINIYDVMEENFESEQLKAAISIDSVLGAHMGPRSPNTVFTYLYHKLGEVYGYKGPAVVEGGMGSLGEALASSAQASGVKLRCASKVEKIEVDVDQVAGVTLTDGEFIPCNTVVSNVDPKATFENLVGFNNIETGVVRRVSNLRMQGNAAKLHLALSAVPQFTGLDDAQLGQRLIISPNMKQIDQAFNSAKYGEFSGETIMDVSIPSLHDSTLAPEGSHVLSAIVQYAPYNLKQGWSQQARDSFMSLIVEQLEQYAPGIGELIVEKQLLTPVDLSEKFNLTGGHWHHGEISVDQIMMMRPFPGASQYATSVDGLYLCGAGSHPGGGVMGLAGRNAAREIAKRQAKR